MLSKGQREDPPTMKFTWKVENFTLLNTKKLYSEEFVFGGFKWRMLIFPKGNNVDYLSMYLEVVDDFVALPYAQISLAVVNQMNAKDSIKKYTQHQFSARENDWGYTSFISLRDLSDPTRDYLVDDTVTVEAEVRLTKEKKEDERRHNAKAHLYITIKVARDEDLAEQIGRDIYFDLVDLDKVHSFHIQKQTPFSLFKEEVAKQFGIPVQFQRFWRWTKRENNTYRLDRPLTSEEESKLVGDINPKNVQLKLFLEVAFGPDLCPIPLPAKSEDDIMLFFKLYDPEKQKLSFVGRLLVDRYSEPVEILARLNKLAGFPPEEEIELYEEVYFQPSLLCEHVDKWASFTLSQIEDGDIICFQKSTKLEYEEECIYSSVPSFLEYIHNRQLIRFRSLEKPREECFRLELSRRHTYDDLVEKVARQIGVEDPTKIRLTAHNCYCQRPNPHPIKYRGVEQLTDMLVQYNQSSDILYYEVLDIPLPELQALKSMKVAFHYATKDELVILNIKLPKQSTVEDVISVLKTKVQLSDPNAELRLLEVFSHKIYKILPCNEKIENINDQCWTLRAEEIPEEEKNVGLHDRLVQVYHFTKESPQNQKQVEYFGEPFFLVIHEGETLAEVKVRVQTKLKVPHAEFSKWKFAFLSLGCPEYPQDSDIVSSRFQRRDADGACEQYLVLEHSDNAFERTNANNQGFPDCKVSKKRKEREEGAQEHSPCTLPAAILTEVEVDESSALIVSSPTLGAHEAAQVTLESMTAEIGNGDIKRQRVGLEVTTQSFEDLAGPSSSPKEDYTLGMLSAAEELLKYTAASEFSGYALAAFETVRRYSKSSLATLCANGAYEEFTAALKLLTEQGGIPLKIISMLNDLLNSLEGEIPKYVAAEKELAQGQEFPAQHKEIKAQMKLSMQKCQKRKDILANYDIKVEAMEAALAKVKAKRAEAMTNLKTAVDEMEPVKQSFVESCSKSESLAVKQAILTLQKSTSHGIWDALRDLLKKYFC